MEGDISNTSEKVEEPKRETIKLPTIHQKNMPPKATIIKTRMLADLLHQSTKRHHFFNFVFSFFTDFNLLMSEPALLTSIISILFLIYMFFFTTFPDLFYLHSESNVLYGIIKGFHDVFHPDLSSNPYLLFYTVPFIAQLVILAISIFTYIGLFIFKIQRFLGSIYQYFFLIVCSSLSPLFLNFSLSNSIYTILLYLFSEHNDRLYILLYPLFAVLSVPAFIITLYRGFIDVKINNMPSATTNPRSALIWYLGTLTFTTAETIFIVISEDDNISRLIILIFLIIISGYMTFYSFSSPFFLPLFSKIITSIISLCQLTSSIFMILQIFGKFSFLLYVIVAFDAIGIFISIGVHIIIGNSLNYELLQEEFDVRSYDAKKLTKMLTYCLMRNKELLIDRNLINHVFAEFEDDLDLKILALRYVNQNPEFDPELVFQKSVLCMKLSFSNFFQSLCLTIMIDMTSSLLKRNSKKEIVRQQLLDEMIDDCIDLHMQFWRAVIQDNPIDIAEAGTRLYFKVRDSMKFFKQLGANVEKQDNVGIKYVDFLMNISADLLPLENVEIDLNKPMPFDAKFAMQNPRRDSTMAEDKMGGFVEIEEREETKPKPKKARRKAKPVKKKLISQDRIELAQSVKETELPQSMTRKRVLMAIYIISYLLTIVIFIMIIVLFANLKSHEAKVNKIYNGQLVLCETSFHTISYITRLIYQAGAYFGQTKEGIMNEIKDARVVIENKNLSPYFSEFTIKNTFDIMEQLLRIEFHNESELVNNQLFQYFITNYSVAINDTLNAYNSIHVHLIENHESINSSIKQILLDSSIVMIVFYIVLIIVILCSYKSIRGLFWQTLLIDKADVANVFHAFLHTNINRDRRFSSRTQLQLSVQKSGKSGFYLVTFRILCFLKIPIIFFILFLIVIGFSFTMKNTLRYSVRCSIGAINSGTLASLFSASLYQMIALSGGENRTNYEPWFQSTTLAFYQTLLSHNTTNYSDYGVINDYDIQIPISIQLQPLLSFPLYPLRNETTNTYFEFSISTLFLTFFDLSLRENISDTSIIKMDEIIMMGAIFNRFSEETYDLYEGKKHRITTIIVIIWVFFLVLSFYMVYFAISGISDLKNLSSFLIRIILLLPDKTPFVNPNSTEINLFQERPDSLTDMLLENLPIAFMVTDKKQNIIHANTKAVEFFGKDVFDKNIKDLETPPMRHYHESRYPISEFPYHPFDPVFDGYSYYVYYDISKLKLEEAEIDMINKELNGVRKSLLPPIIISNKRIQTQNILLISRYSIVEVEFPETIKQEHFIEIKRTVHSSLSHISTFFIHDFSRQSVFIMFGSFNIQYHQRQYLRDAVKCGHMISDLSKVLQSANGTKISITSGEKCICRITDNETIHIDMFPTVSNKSSALLHSAAPSEVIVEASLLKAITTNAIDESIGTLGHTQISGMDVDYYILKTFPV